MRSVATTRGLALLLVGVLALAGCTSGLGDRDNEAGAAPSPSSATGPATPPASPAGPAPTPSRSTPTADSPTLQQRPTERETERETQRRRANAVIKRIPDRQWQRIVEVGAWRPGCPVGRADLRRVRVNHVNFDGKVRRGTLVVNKDVARSVARIFTRLFQERFPIRRMRPVEVYGGDVNVSLSADNTSAYNCRQLTQINAPVKESPHANGRAIDINPRENPWIDLRCDCWTPSPKNRERKPAPGKILRGGLVWRLFHREGWVWQNIDVPDYMHFDTGYPSRPYRGPEANKRLVERQQRAERREEQRHQHGN